MAQKIFRKFLTGTLAILIGTGAGCGPRRLSRAEKFVREEGGLPGAGPAQKLLFEKVCGDYLNAYHENPRLFDLKKIRHAAHACLLAQDYQTARTFLRFQADYLEGHPGESLRREPWLDFASPKGSRSASPVSKPGEKSALKPLFS